MSLSERIIPTISLEKWRRQAEDARTTQFPILITDAFTHLLAKWSLDRLVESWPDKTVNIAIKLPDHGIPYKEYTHRHLKHGTLKQGVTLIRNGKCCYINQVPIETFPQLKQDIDYEALGLNNVLSVNLWIGGRTRSGLHYDYADNLFGQICGKKRVLLIHPKYTKYVYPFSDNPLKSQIDVENPDLISYPLYVHCELFTCEVEPGTGLYIPRGWWHYIAADDVSMSINCWHGKCLTKEERLRMILATGPRVVGRAIWDFAWHGVLRRPYQLRLFSLIPPGLQIYNKLKSKIVSII